MARKFLIPITPPSLSSDPTSSPTASIYFNTTDNELKIFNGSAWTGIADSYLSKANTFTVGPQTINTGDAANGGLVIQAFTSQNAALLQVKNSNNSLISQISGTGRIYSAVSLTAGSISTATATINAFPTNASTVAMLAKGFTSQTANLQEWQNSAGTVLASISALGQLNSTYKANFTNQQFTTTSVVNITSNGTGTGSVGLVIKGAASQTADLQQWQDSTGTVLLSVGPSGRLLASARVGINDSSYTGTFNVTSFTAGATVAIIKGAASQTANLTEWQDSVGTIKTRVSASGAVVTSSVGVFGSQSAINNSQVTILNNNLSYPAITVKGASGQTANLQEWQDSTGGLVAVINNSGQFATYGRLTVGSSSVSTDARMVLLNTGITTSVLQIIRGMASQTGDLTQWQDSTGGVLLNVDSTGNLNIGAGSSNIWKIKNQTSTVMEWQPSQGFMFLPYGSSNRPITIKGAESQTANLTEWQDSAGTAQLSISNTGDIVSLGNRSIRFAYHQNVGGTGAYIDYAQTFNTASIIQRVTTAVGLIVKGAESQTANLQQWQDSNGTVLASIDSAGQFNATNGSQYGKIGPSGFQSGGLSGITDIHYNGGNVTIRGGSAYTSNTSLLVSAGYAGGIGQIIKGAASQTANLQEWQNSSGAILSRIGSSGFARIGGANGLGTGITSASLGVGSVDFSWNVLVVKGGATQTGDLTQWQNSAGTVLSKITATGMLDITPTSGDTINFRNSSGGLTLWGGNSRYYMNTELQMTGGNWASGRLGIDTTDTGNIGLVVRGVASQTANLQEWQGDSGSVLSTVGPLGAVNINTSNANALGAIGIGALEVKRTAFFDTGTTTNVGIIVRGRASQTGDLQQWQDSAGTALATITSSGDYLAFSGTRFRTYTNSAFGSLMLWDGRNNQTTLYPASSGFLILNNGVVGMNVVKVRGASGQTGNLQEWQNSSGTVLSAITSIGQKTIGSSIPLTNSAVQQSITAVTFTSTTATYTFTSTLQTMTVGDYVTVSGIDPVGYNGTFQVTAIATVSAGSSYSFTVANTTNTTVVIGTGLVALSAGLSVTIPDKAHTGIIIKAAANQSAAMMEFRTSTGALSTWWDANGAMTASTAVISTLYSGGFMNTGTLGYFNATTFNPAVSPVVIRGAASQSTHYLQIQNSIGTLLWGINSSGESSTRTTTKFGANIQNDSNNANTALSVSAPSTSGNGIALYVYSGSATRDIAKFDNSGVVKLTVTSDGSLKGGNSSTISANTATTVDTVAISSFTTIEYTLSIKQGSKIRSSKVLVHTDGTSVDSTEYGIIEMGGGITGILVAASVSSTNSILQITITDAATTNATVKLIKTML